jgi:hypothetical protein
MSGTTTHRSSGMAYCGRYLPAAIGSSPAPAYTGTSRTGRARRRRRSGRDGGGSAGSPPGARPGPKTASAAARIAAALSAQPPSTSIHPASERTRYTLDAAAPLPR